MVLKVMEAYEYESQVIIATFDGSEKNNYTFIKL
jgi:hypothetical protein